MTSTIEPRVEHDRVRRATSRHVLRQIDERIEDSVRYYATQPVQAVGERIEQLQREWSIERYLQLHVATTGFLTSILALTHHRKWGLVTGTALAFFLLHALQGFDPPLPILRRLGVRTRQEINWEIYALRALRGDFNDDPVKVASPSELSKVLLTAVRS